MSMEFEEHEEQEEEIGMPVQASYDSIANSIRTKMGISTGSGEGGGGASAAARKAAIPIRYRECLKNHAVNIGGHALDGCGEFMAAGDEGTLDALKCAACNCHRNFHRKETEGGEGGGVGGGGGGLYHHQQQQQHHQQISAAYYRPPAGYLHLTPSHPRPLALPSVSGGGGYSRDEDDVSNPSSSGGGGGSGGSKKRFRTKFTGEQKEKMLGFAETLGWRIQKHDEASVEQFCAESGVKRQVLKVWMHNNKNTLGKKP